MKKFIAMLMILCFSSFAFAEGDAVMLNKGDAAPWTGFLISREKVDKIYKMDLDLSFQTKKSEILEQQLKLSQDQITRDREFIKDQSDRIQDMKDSTIWTKIGFFVLGCVITTGVAYGVSRATSN